MTILNPYFYTLNPDILAYENAWLNYRKTGERNPAVIRDAIWNSWQRCKEQKMEPLSEESISGIGESDTLNRISRYQKVLPIISSFLNTIYDAVKGQGFMVMFCDNDAVVLQCVCDEDLQERAKELELAPGANMDESQVGTNSIDLAIRLRKPMSVTGAEHYKEMFHSLTSASVPLVDYSGNLLGVLSVWGRHEHATPHILGMLVSSAKAIESEIQIKKINEQLIENNNQMKAILQSVSDGVIYIKDHNITQINDEMLRLIGTSKIRNKNIEDIIITMPEIRHIIDGKPHTGDTVKVTLFGEKKKYNCIVNRKTVLGSNLEEIGQVLIFKQVEEIKNLIKTINRYAAVYTFEDIIGKAEVLKEAIDIAKKAAEHDSRIVIEGESGTGKEMFAQAIHNASERRNNPFVAIDCGAVPKELFESTLFGYEKGAFTGAKAGGSVGAFETAQKGTLFLDEIGNMPLDMQIKLLRVLQERVVTKVGSSTPIPVDVRVIAATNINLQTLVERGDFREDLFYRLNVVYIKTPPLRDRKTDIPALVQGYLHTSGIRNKKMHIDAEAIVVLQKYNWPGNIRQLYNAIERAEIMTAGTSIKASDLPLEILETTEMQVQADKTGDESEAFYNEEMTLKEMTKKYILYSLNKNGNNIRKTAQLLDITRPTIYKVINSDDGGMDK